MLRKAYTPVRLLMESLFLITSGLMLFFRPANTLMLAMKLGVWLLLLGGLLALADGLLHLKENRAPLAKGLLLMLAAGFVLAFPRFLTQSVTMLYAFWVAVNALFKFIYAIQLRRDKQRGMMVNLVSGSIMALFAAALFFQPLQGVVPLAVLLGAYCVVYGLFVLGDGVRELLLVDVRGRRIKQRIRVAPPILLTAFIPPWLLKTLNDPNEADEVARWTRRNAFDDHAEADLRIFFHLAKTSAMGMGHVDIALGNKVYTYGCYDVRSNKLFGMISDGVLVTADLEPYIAYCMAHENKKLICFGVSLTEEQQRCVAQAAAKFMEGSELWQPPEDDAEALRAREANAIYHKLRSGRFQTYNVLKTNCVALADILCGASGLDLMNQQGIITPGTYYAFLNRQFLRPNSIVISRTVYNEDITANDSRSEGGSSHTFPRISH